MTPACHPILQTFLPSMLLIREMCQGDKRAEGNGEQRVEARFSSSPQRTYFVIRFSLAFDLPFIVHHAELHS